MYVIFDLETTGRSRYTSEIIELAAIILDSSGIQVEDGSFVQFIKPTTPIPSYITTITSISNQDVKDAKGFAKVGESFIQFMTTHAEESETAVEHIVFVGHNSRAFDVPILIRQLDDYQLTNMLIGNARFGWGLDTMKIAREAIKVDTSIGVPTNFQLPILYQFVVGSPPATSHRALADVQATAAIFRFQPFWEHRKKWVFAFSDLPGRVQLRNVQEQVVLPPQSQHADDDSSASYSSSSSSSDDEDENDVAQGDVWTMGDYYPQQPTPMEEFNRYTSLPTRSVKHRLGVLCHPLSINTPIRAWRKIFTKAILDSIVKYTNDYGCVHAKRWSDVSKVDLESFIAVLFVSGIQKRKDKPSNWFSTDHMLESPVIKRIMTGRKFFTMLRYLHCCPVENQNASAPDYNPSYKISELKDALEDRFLKLFEPGQQLSLDETLIRAFGRIKFKVRLITKAARYGIKLYVVTDAVTAFVLKVIIYTGTSTYAASIGEPDAIEKKKTVQIVENLLEPYAGSHRTVYVDRFYTSVDLMKALAEKELYITGTMLATRIPLQMRLAKTSAEYKNMKRGDVIKRKIRFTIDGNRRCEGGLVCWKDRNIVYCLSNDTNNVEVDECTRRGDGGLVRIPRPISIANYNKFMGGVDLADMKRLHCSSLIMGQNRWWLKIFFYLLDIGTSNALVLHNEFLKQEAATNSKDYTPMNIVEFKKQLVEELVGRSVVGNMEKSDDQDPHLHIAVRIQGAYGRAKCANCALMSRSRRTRYQCAICGVPLCVMGSGKINESDCFTMAHESEARRDLVLKKYFAMQQPNNKQK
jgi:DNA polymerase III epsilon subunit-like protein